MLKKVAWLIALIVLAFVAVGQFLPAERSVQRSIVIERPQSLVFAVLNGYRHFNRWSPWAARDPRARYQYSGPDSGEGARMDWDGDPRVVGSGWQQIIRSDPYGRIDLRLDFGEQGTARSGYRLQPVADGTLVTWQFHTDVTQGKGLFDRLLARYFGIFLSRWVGDDYEQGLASLKAYVESLPEADFADFDIQVVHVQPQTVLQVNGSSEPDASAVAQALASAFAEIIRYMSDHELESGGQPMALTWQRDTEGYEFTAALPVTGEPPEPDTADESENAVTWGQSPAGKAVRIVHVGPYEALPDTYDALESYLAAHGLETTGLSWEHYISDPADTVADERITHVYVQLEGEPAQSAAGS